jgi:hypothetical protein
MLLLAMRTMASAGLLDAMADALGDGCHGAPRRRGVELHPAAEEEVGVDAAEHDVGVGGGGLAAAAAVAGRAGHGAGALRPDAQQPALVDPGDRAAAGADGADVDHRHLDRQAPLDLEARWCTMLHGRRSTVEQSVEVPPMSKVTMPVDAGERGDMARVATTPPLGPETAVSCTGAAAAAPSSVASPPFDLITADCCRRCPIPSPSRRCMRREVARDLRLQVGVGDGGRRPLIFLPASAAPR